MAVGRTGRYLLRACMLAGLPAVLAACEGRQSALDAAGAAARDILVTGWALFVGGTVIFLAVMGLALYAALARPERFPGRLSWVVGGGLLFPVVTLTALQIHEFGLARRLAVLAPDPALVVEVTGVMWWWDVRYHADGADPVRGANEIVLPAGRPVELRVTSADVIHSFWVPSLAGKIDMIPGHVNRLPVVAERPGLYRGQCAEYCGAQHALMAFDVRVLPAGEFDAWLAARRRPPPEPATPELARGRDAFFAVGCHACHAVHGTAADGLVGPDLSGIGARPSLAAGTLPNRVETIAAWIQAAQHIKPESRMPSFDVMDGDTLHAMAAWLESLK
ncbi:cytochrome c oxidase subunit II [Azospirillum picis]|uniref:Cytochrome aa3 subunit 2 n=1 Tax=Azospirillum picis TaxID=488438 RepID=A0ABU0MRB4_9PROT|nr:cytochrome c oxidase subunit II [Azospirillum picis]MBP2302442.1 cytochrome c oxidase subunit 2 [Azospirillum picis]MDQ0536021.1 cytochrome c oxidase subunit 2 [Azospirillum picis]